MLLVKNKLKQLGCLLSVNWNFIKAINYTAQHRHTNSRGWTLGLCSRRLKNPRMPQSEPPGGRRPCGDPLWLLLNGEYNCRYMLNFLRNQCSAHALPRLNPSFVHICEGGGRSERLATDAWNRFPVSVISRSRIMRVHLIRRPAPSDEARGGKGSARAGRNFLKSNFSYFQHLDPEQTKPPWPLRGVGSTADGVGVGPRCVCVSVWEVEGEWHQSIGSEMESCHAAHQSCSSYGAQMAQNSFEPPSGGQAAAKWWLCTAGPQVMRWKKIKSKIIYISISIYRFWYIYIYNTRQRWLSTLSAEILCSLFRLKADKISFSHQISRSQDEDEWSREVQYNAENMQRKCGWSFDLVWAMRERKRWALE